VDFYDGIDASFSICRAGRRLPILRGDSSRSTSANAQVPRRVPRWLGRLLVGEAFTIMMTEARGASNAKAKRELGWEPRHPSMPRAFAEGAV
jgi:hypothetical protein